MGELFKTIIKEAGNIAEVGVDELKGAAESLGLYESDLKKAYRRRAQLDQLRPEMDSLLTDLQKRAEARPNLWQEQFEKQQEINALFEKAYNKQLKVIELAKPQIDAGQDEDPLLGAVTAKPQAAQPEEAGLSEYTEPYTASPDAQLPTTTTEAASTDTAPTDRIQADQQKAQLLQGEAPGILDALSDIKDRLDVAGEQGVVNAMNAFAQLPRVAGNLGILAPYSGMSNEQRLLVSQELGAKVADRLSAGVEEYRPSLTDAKRRGAHKDIEGISDIGSFGDAVQVVGENLPLMTMLIGSYMMNPVLGTGMMFGIEGGDTAQMIDEMEKETGIKVDPEQKRLATTAVGAINAALEKIGFSKILKTLDDIPGIKAKVMTWLMGAGTEGFTEFFQQWTSILAGQGVEDDPKFEKLNIKEKFDSFWTAMGKAENWDEAGLSAFVGIATGAGMATPGTVGGIVQEATEEKRIAEIDEQIGTAIQDEIQGTEGRQREARHRPQKKARKAAERQEVVKEAKEKRSQAESFQVDLFGKTQDSLTPLERRAAEAGLPIVKKDGSPYSEAFLRRRLKAVKKRAKTVIPETRVEPTPETDIL
ncbi:MAG: hypothetical protein ACYS7Y_35475, partial [Planctomycetota bacterium]